MLPLFECQSPPVEKRPVTLMCIQTLFSPTTLAGKSRMKADRLVPLARSVQELFVCQELNKCASASEFITNIKHSNTCVREPAGRKNGAS